MENVRVHNMNAAVLRALAGRMQSLASDQMLGLPDFVIGPANDPYLLRWHIQRDPKDKGCIYLHQILKSDDDRAMHDHPWDSTSIILDGTLIEVTPERYESSWLDLQTTMSDSAPESRDSHIWLAQGEKRRELVPGSIVQRRAEDAHRLEVNAGAVWTLFITGPKTREWGFHCPNGWIHHADFVDQTNTGLPGKGCSD